jgi:alcohol dehydrogenase class IV
MPADAPTAAAPRLRPEAGTEPQRFGPGDTGWAGAQPIRLLQPPCLFFGNGCLAQFAEHLTGLSLQRVLVLTSAAVRAGCAAAVGTVAAAVASAQVLDPINQEPDTVLFEACLAAARGFRVDGVIGIGGGSVLDVAKLVAALADAPQSVNDVFGSGLLKGRRVFLACLPTTAGTGSEVSPNAILFNQASRMKQAVISPHLVPDVACVDPQLTWSAPPSVTASSGLDALTHCLEAYANRHAHPAVDLHALEGIRLIARHLPAAIANGQDADARAAVALGSLYGGLCLGPVNTAAVHALAYPLGSDFGLAHGLSNAVLLPHVLRFNLPAAPQRYAEIALALGVQLAATAHATAEQGIRRIESLLAGCPMPQRLGELGVPRSALPDLARSAMTVTRLLKNNLRPLTAADAEAIYAAAF